MEKNNGWLLDDNEEDDSECPSFILTKEEKGRIRRPWKRTLIIKLLGQIIGYMLLYKKIYEMWKPRALMDLVAMDNGFFLARFSSEKDFDLAKYERPWMIFNHYLTVRQL